jgi:hypothetical protein
MTKENVIGLHFTVSPTLSIISSAMALRSIPGAISILLKHPMIKGFYIFKAMVITYLHPSTLSAISK